MGLSKPELHSPLARRSKQQPLGLLGSHICMDMHARNFLGKEFFPVAELAALTGDHDEDVSEYIACAIALSREGTSRIKTLM